MREQATRYCLVLVILVLAGMYFPAMQRPYPGWLPPATQAELQTYNPGGFERVAVNGTSAVNASANLDRDDVDANPTVCAYTSCDSPLHIKPADFDSAF